MRADDGASLPAAVTLLQKLTDGEAVLLAGEAGIGKSRTLEDVRQRSFKTRAAHAPVVEVLDLSTYAANARKGASPRGPRTRSLGYIGSVRRAQNA